MSEISKENIDVSELANYIFKKNDCKELYININCLKTKKELFFFLFDIFCKGIILLYGENNKIKLNNLGPHQFEEIEKKLRYAHIKLNMIHYDLETAMLLDLLPQNEVNERNIIQESINDIMKMNDNANLYDYVIKLFMNNTLFCINFDIIR
jgi:hypothetical protein